MDKVTQKDIEELIEHFSFVDQIKDSTVLITGAAGLVGSFLYKFLHKLNVRKKLNIKIKCIIRDILKIEEDYRQLEDIEWIIQDIRHPIYINTKIDYIFHAASPTSSKFFVSNPVDTISTAYEGTKNILNFACENEVKSIVFLSSIEVYGVNYEKMKLLKESDIGYLDILDIRSSYSESKRLCENLCVAYNSQFNTNAKIARLTQVLAPFKNDDNRLCAHLCKSIKNDKNVVLNTFGETSKPYIYITDAINALFYILFLGENSLAYNIADEESYMSAYDLANTLSNKYLNKDVVVNVTNTNIYPKATYNKLDTTSLKNLGWKCKTSILNAFDNLINNLERSENNE